ncbi:MAG: hypothetical protein J5I93_04770 [Pirellulaceae bacterium]|nr:hypothetical protein [Pirellulaceae bacterium]
MSVRHLRYVLAACLLAVTAGQAHAGLCGLAGQMARRHALHGCGDCDVQCCTVLKTTTRTTYENITETRFKTVYDTTYERQVVQGVDRIPITRYEDREYTYHRPLVEVLTRQEPYTVTWPVYETMSKDVHYVTYIPTYETKTTQVPYTTYHPVTETTTRTVHYSVPRTVHTTHTIPIHTGHWVTRTEEQPGPVLQRCVQEPGCWKWDPCCCRCVYVPGPCRMVEVQCPPIKVCRRVWVPRVEHRTVTNCQVVYESRTREVPHTTTRMVPETHTRPITYTMTRMMPVNQSRTIHYQVARTMSEVRTRTVTQPVTRMVPETGVQRVPVTTFQEVPTSSTIVVPKSIPRTVSYTVTRCVPRTELIQVPVRVCVSVPRCDYDPGCCAGCDAPGCDAPGCDTIEGQTPPAGDNDDVAPLAPEEPAPLSTPVLAAGLQVGEQGADASLAAEASRAFGRGLSHLWNGESDAAIRQLQIARDADASSAKYAYFLALALRQADRGTEADRTLADAVELERRAPISGWGQLMQRVQGADRLWIETARGQLGR